MKLVVDSSVVVKWFVEEPHREAAASLLDGDDLLLAPDIILAEVANALWRKVRTGEVEMLQVEEAIRELPSLLDLHALDSGIAIEALSLARQLEHAKISETRAWTNIRDLSS